MCWKIHRSDIGFVAPCARLDELIAKLKPLSAALDAAGSR
jgi:hypothetical protein